MLSVEYKNLFFVFGKSNNKTRFERCFISMHLLKTFTSFNLLLTFFTTAQVLEENLGTIKYQRFSEPYAQYLFVTLKTDALSTKRCSILSLSS